MWLHLIAHKYRDITRCVNRATLIDQIQQARKTLEKLLSSLQSAPVERDRLFLISISPGGTTAERAKLPEVRKVNRGAILCSRKQGSTPAPGTIDKASRDEYYASLLASMQNNSGPKPAVKSAKLAEPSADAIYNAYPTEGRDSTAMSSATAVAAITILAVPAGSRQTETLGSRKQPLIHGVLGSAERLD